MPGTNGERTGNQALLNWVEDMTRLCKPDQVYWCDGSDAEFKRLCTEMVAAGTLIELNQEKRPFLGKYVIFVDRLTDRGQTAAAGPALHAGNSHPVGGLRAPPLQQKHFSLPAKK